MGAWSQCAPNVPLGCLKRNSTQTMSEPTFQTLSSLIEEMAERYPKRPAVTYKNKTINFSEFRRLAIDCAKALHSQGVRRGDNVGILMGNCIEWLVVNFAIQYLGATMVALNTWYTKSELEHVLAQSDVSLLISTDNFLNIDFTAMINAMNPISKALPLLRQVVTLGIRVAQDAVLYEDFLSSGKGVPDNTILKLHSEVMGEDVAYLLYTSGSTARPKGVMLIHKHLIGNMFDIGKRLHFSKEDICYMPLSLFWGMGCMNMLLGPWTHGMHIVLQEHFDAVEGLKLIQDYRCTVFSGTANIIHAIYKHPERHRYDLSSIRKGTPLGSPSVSRELIETVMPLGVRIYGLTESHGFATMHDATDPIEKRATTDGRLMPGFELRIVSPETGAVLGPGEIGEVRLRGRIMKGYYKDPEGTTDSFDNDGYFKTGDIGKIDTEGYLHFMGRYKEMLKTGGINVSPIEVEEVLLKHPAVREAFVTGLPDPVREQVVAAVIVLAEGTALDQDELIRYCRSQLAAYKVPQAIRFVTMDDIPQTTTRKVNRLSLAILFKSDT